RVFLDNSCCRFLTVGVQRQAHICVIEAIDFEENETITIVRMHGLYGSALQHLLPRPGGNRDGKLLQPAQYLTRWTFGTAQCSEQTIDLARILATVPADDHRVHDIVDHTESARDAGIRKGNGSPDLVQPLVDRLEDRVRLAVELGGIE